MGTGLNFANYALKKILSFEDFGERTINFLMSNLRELSADVYDADGIFDTKITIGGSANPNEVVLAQGAPADFRGTDGLGNIIGLEESGSEDATVGQIKAFQIENTISVDYHLSLQYVERPNGIQVNPRNGNPQYTMMTQAVGVSAAPDNVVDNGGTITFTIDSSCESSNSHAGRTAIVYMVTPASGAITAALAIESLTVSWDGSNNKITTADILGQSTVSTTESDYLVVLLGPSVRKADTSDTAGHAYLGTVTGTGLGTVLGAGDNGDQTVVTRSISSSLVYPAGSDWADGTTNPESTIVDQVEKIITDLVSTTGVRGLGKLTAAARTSWADSETNPAANADVALDKIITDLTSDGAGTERVDSPAISSITDQGGSVKAGDVSVTAGSIKDQIEEILDKISMPRKLSEYAARNYVPTDDITSASITDFLEYNSDTTPPRFWVAVGGTADIKYTNSNIFRVWYDGPSWTGTPTSIEALMQTSDDDLLVMVGNDASGAIIQYTADDLSGAWAAATMIAPTDLYGRSAHCTSGGKYLAGFEQKVGGVGTPIQYTNHPPSTAFANAVVPATLHTVYAFAENSSGTVFIAVGVDTSGTEMICRSSNGMSYTDETGSWYPIGSEVVDVAWDEYRQKFWALTEDTILLSSDINGENWVKSSGVLSYGSCSSLAIDPYHGIMVMNSSIGGILVSSNGEWADDIDVSGKSAYIIKWLNGRFHISSELKILVGGTAIGGIDTSIEF